MYVKTEDLLGNMQQVMGPVSHQNFYIINGNYVNDFFFFLYKKIN